MRKSGLMTPREKENLSELIAALRTFPVEEMIDMELGKVPWAPGKFLGHYIGLAWTVLMQRRIVIEALEKMRR